MMKVRSLLNKSLRRSRIIRNSPISSNINQIKEEFTKQSTWFEKDWSARSVGKTEDIMNWVIKNLYLQPAHSNGRNSVNALDIASGTGIFARSLAKVCKSVTALDATEAMLKQAEIQAPLEGLNNIDFIVCDASNISFPDNSFDIVTCRLAIHHFSNPIDQIKEMTRVCKIGGKVVVVDIIATENVDEAKEQNRLETLRDPSHTSCLSIKEIVSLFNESNLYVPFQDRIVPSLDNAMDLQAWMESTKTPPHAKIKIEKSIQIELDGGSKTGMRPYVNKDDNKIHFIHTYVIIQGIKK